MDFGERKQILTEDERRATGAEAGQVEKAGRDFSIKSFDEEKAEADLTGEIAQELGARVGEALEAVLVNPEENVGEESELQIEERLQDDAEDAQAEQGVGLGSEVVIKKQEDVAKAVVPEVEKLMAAKEFHPAQVEQLLRVGAARTLAIWGRKLGDRN